MTPRDHLFVAPALPGAEPEEAPAKRVQSYPLRVNVAKNPFPHLGGRSPFTDLRPARETVIPVTSEMPAGEAAQLARRRCWMCQHYRPDLWLYVKGVAERSPMGSAAHENFRQKFLAPHAKRLGVSESDASADLQGWGLCVLKSEIAHSAGAASPTAVAHPQATCDDFEPRGFGEGSRAGDRDYDTVMHAAEGKKE